MKNFLIVIVIILAVVAIFNINRIQSLFTDKNIRQELTVLTPNGGETFQAGGKVLVTWKSTKPSDAFAFTLEFRNPAGSTSYNFKEFTLGKKIVNGKVNLDIPLEVIPNADYFIRVTDISRKAEGIEVSDESDAKFTITSSVQPSIEVVNPSKSMNWRVGSKQYVQWKTSPTIPRTEKVRINLVDANGYEHLVTDVVNDGNETITIPQLEAGNYKVQVTIAGTFYVYDYSESDVAIK